MAPIESHRGDHLKAGVFVVIALIIFVIVLISLAGGMNMLQPTASYTIRFPVSVGVAGLDAGSDVRVGGRTVGRVGAITLAQDDPDRPPIGVDVRVHINRGIPIYSDAGALLVRPLFGSGATINFPSLGGQPGSSRLDANARIPGATGPSDLLSSAGIGPEEFETIKNIIQRLDDTTQRTAKFVDTIELEIVPNMRHASATLDSIATEFQARSAPWFDSVDAFSGELSTFSMDANAAITEAREFIANLDRLVTDNKESVTRSVAHLENTSEKAEALLTRLNDQSITLINDLLADGRTRLDEAGDLIDRVSSLFAEESPEIRKTFANLRLASDQLKLTMGEVRRSPWRLLYRPNTRELEYELLYDSARTYASAVSDLRAASESLESAVGADRTRLSTDGQSLDGYVGEIKDAFEKYREAEQTLLDALLKQPAR